MIELTTSQLAFLVGLSFTGGMLIGLLIYSQRKDGDEQ